MNKVIRNNKVAVLYSPGYGAGWYSWHHRKELVFHPVLVELVEQNRQEEITEELVSKLLKVGINDCPYLGGAKQLTIDWIPEGTLFRINEYDGYESIDYKENNDWLVA